MSRPWYEEAFFYHIYPLGFCGAPARNDQVSAPVDRLSRVADWAGHLKSLGVNAVYFGPLFESESHGYDTVDWTRVDRRLGTTDALKCTIRRLHAEGIRVVVDGVFHHVGRAFFAFEDVQHRRQQSAFRDWIAGLDFSRRNPRGDPFAYEGWEGHLELVKLNLRCPAVVEYLLGVVRRWVAELDIDGIRLDVAYALDRGFVRRLAELAPSLKPDLWLMGEMIHGNYASLAGPGRLHSVTNYESYKGLYSSHNDGNYFEIAHTLDRQFGDPGLYRDLYLYNFADNHDVDRVASRLRDPRHLYPLHLLLFTMPGIPSVYYGSEWGVEGRKQNGDGGPLRPALELDRMRESPHADLAPAISRLARLRRSLPALRHGRYQPLHVDAHQFVFLRRHGKESVVVAVNAAGRAVTVTVRPGGECRRFVELLNGSAVFPLRDGEAAIDLPPNWGRVLRVE